MPVFDRCLSFAYGAVSVTVLAAAACLWLGAADASARDLRLVAFGDSLTAGLGLAESDAFSAKLEAALRAQGHDVTVVNAGVSGDTTSDGLARLEWTLGDGADAVILELGANDMLRGLKPQLVEANLAKILAALEARHIKVLLVGMRASPTLGQAYDQSFDAIYPTLAARYGVPLYPFFLDGIVGDRALHLADQMHPTGAGVDVIVRRILPDVDKLIESAQAKS